MGILYVVNNDDLTMSRTGYRSDQYCSVQSMI
jgi:hypothetical protein